MKRLRTVGVLWAIAVVAMVLGTISPAQGDITLVPSGTDRVFDGTTRVTGPLLLSNGSAAAPSAGWYADADGSGTGFFRSSANVTAVSSNGTSVWLWGTTGNFLPTTNNANDLGGSSNNVRDFFLAKSMQGGSTKTLTESAATGFVTVAVANSTGVAGRVAYTIRASDATNTQAVTGELFFSCVATAAGVVTCGSISDQHTQNPVSSGTLTNTMTNTTAANAVTLLANSVSSLTQTTLRIDYRVELFGTNGAVTGL